MEILLLTLPEVFVYKLGARSGSAGYTALSWGLDKPLLTGYLRVVAHGESEVSLAVWQRPDQMLGAAASVRPSAEAAAAAAAAISTAPGAAGHKLVAVCRIPLRPRAEAAAAAAAAGAGEQPHLCLLPQPLAYYLEPTLDSSRYFALRIAAAAAAGGRSAVLGIGFRDRQASFDLRSALDDVLQRVARSWGLAAIVPRRTGAGAGASGGGGGGGGDAAAAAAAVLAALPDMAIGPLAPRASGAAAAPPAPQPLIRLAAPRAFASPESGSGGGDVWGDFAAAAAPAEEQS